MFQEIERTLDDPLQVVTADYLWMEWLGIVEINPIYIIPAKTILEVFCCHLIPGLDRFFTIFLSRFLDALLFP